MFSFYFLCLLFVQITLGIELEEKIHKDERFKRAILNKDLLPFDSHISYYIAYKKHSQKVISALNDLSNQTCFDFVKLKNEFKHKGMIFKTSDCNLIASANGTDAPTVIYLETTCSSKIGCIKHHIGLALGLIPHQNRWDRNSYVNILYDNIEKANVNEYKKVKGYSVKILNTPFDFGSIMNFERTYFSANGKPTYSSKLNPVYDKMLGQRNDFSFNDIKLLNDMYCGKRCPKKIKGCINGGYPDPKNCDSCKCPPGYRTKLCGIPEDSTGECGAKKLTAKKEYQTLYIKTDKICNHLIVSKPGRKVEVVVVKANILKRKICSHGKGLEIKHRHNKGAVGLSFCGSYKNVSVEPISSQVLVRYYGTDDSNHFAEIKYREV
ncbi:Astacin-like metalloendopeptidase [Strongyloides ratti]|uniref:Metalloendopeptidase n=1 Tax=Strongyloides ratti TaxID=34506 RepID=A0A090LP04_STRRB|nr:Astacin-like metalloendopeptidase [Strongyloides ratti]CEF69919.1 Astacin-like metalloendopeptidase [Strongyloides ratti]